MYNCYPVDYISITTGFSSSHQAIDCGWWGDTSDRPIYSVSSGKVLEIRNDYATQDKTGNSYGNYVIIENVDGSKSTYCHLKYHSVLVKVGDSVKQHQQIATMGTTGHSTAPHLHYEHRINDVKVNPFDYLYCFTDFQSINYEKSDSKYIKTYTPTYKYKVGDYVLVNGYGHTSNEYNSGDTGYYENQIGKIIEIKDGEYPYHIEDMGWFREKYLEPYDDYKVLYEQEVLKNKDLQNQVDNLQTKINNAIEDLK